MQLDQNMSSAASNEDAQTDPEPNDYRGARNIGGRKSPPGEPRAKQSPNHTQSSTDRSKNAHRALSADDSAGLVIDKNDARSKVGRRQISRRELESLLLMDKIEEVLITLRRLIRATDLHSKQLVKTAGLTAPQLLLLQAIREQGQVTIGALAKEISLSQATVTTILDRLEKRGLVYRERSLEDKRKVHAHLTDKGAEIIRDAPTPLQEHFVKQFRDLREWEQSMIISSLQRVALMMDAEHIDASPVLDVGDLDRKDSRSIPAHDDKNDPEHHDGS